MKRYKYHLFLLFLTLFSTPALITVYAANVLTLDANATGNPNTVQVGETIEYFIDFSCSSDTSNCGALEINFDFDPLLVDLIDYAVATGYTATQVDADTIRFTKTNFEDGDASQAVIRLRVREELTGSENIRPTVTGTINGGNATNQPPNITVEPPTELWSVDKIQLLPGDNIDPLTGDTVTYELSFCPDVEIGNAALWNAQLIDTFPAGAIVVDADGGTVNTNDNTITWNLSGAPPTNPLVPSGGCQTRTVTVRYPTFDFPAGTLYTNELRGFGTNPSTGFITPDSTCSDTNCIGYDDISGTITNTPDVRPNEVKTGPSTTLVTPGSTSIFSLHFDLNNSNIPVNNVTFMDTLPRAISNNTLPAINIIAIGEGAWDGGYQAVIEYSTDTGSSPTSWTQIGTTNGTTNSYSNAPVNNITFLRWRFIDTLPKGFAFTAPATYRFEPNSALTNPIDFTDGGDFYRDYANCIQTTYTITGNPPQTSSGDCANVRLATQGGTTNIDFDKSASPDPVNILENVTFTLTVDITEESSNPLVNPTIEDVLPDYLSYIPGSLIATFPTSLTNDETNQPDVITNALPGGETQLLIQWSGASGDANYLNLERPTAGSRTMTITFQAEVLINAPAGEATNSVTIVANSPNLFCQGSDLNANPDGSDIDNDGNSVENTCKTATTYEILEAASLRSQKWIRSISGPTPFLDSRDLDDVNPNCPLLNVGSNNYTRYPCIAQGTSAPTNSFEYLLFIENDGLVDVNNYTLYDVLSHTGDTGVSEALTGANRGSEYIVHLTGPLVLASSPTASFVIEYNTANNHNSCRPEMSATSDESGWQTGCDNNWVTTVADWSTVTSFRIRQTSGVIVPNETILFTVPMQILPYDQSLSPDSENAETGEIAWNSFAQRFNNAASQRRLLTAEPRKVGIIVQEFYSVGNRVWIDDGRSGGTPNDGRINGGEIGIDGVTVELWSDTTGDDVPDTLFATDVTHDNGYYIFDGLPSGRYEIRIPAAEFEVGGDLETYISSTGHLGGANNQTRSDSHDNGIDPSPSIVDYSNGIRSNPFNLTRDNEPTNESDTNPNGSGDEGLFGRGENYEENEDSDLTVDFGFYRPLAIGNRVWLDDGAGTPANRDNGMIDTSEVGIDDVVVNLYRDNNNDGVPDGAAIATTMTVNGGYYLFDLLPPGSYLVQIDPANFAFGASNAGDGSLARYITSTGNQPDNEIDNDDNGVDPATQGDQRTNGVYSETIILTDVAIAGDPEPTGEIDLDSSNPNPIGRRTEDNRSEMTIDFGFFEEVEEMSLGNRVWLDDGAGNGFGNNGQIDVGEAGIDGVIVNLYLDDDGDGVPDGPRLDQRTTSNGGYYLFDGLQPGRYVVQLDPSNWNAGTGVLENYVSNTTTTTENTDSNDNGIDPTNYTDYANDGIYSNSIQLVPQGEPIAGDDDSVSGTGPFGDTTIPDNNSDNTVDFGVYKLMSIGNRIWLDNDNTGTNIPGDGIFDGATESGIDNVTVQLYRDDGTTTGSIDGNDTLVATTTTANDGYYLFDGLPAGNYIVLIPRSNFDTIGDPLYLHFSSDGADGTNGDDGDDNDDNGQDDPNPSANGIASTVINLSQDNERTDESDILASVGDGDNVEPDNSDLAVDFGFFIPPMSIGNRVWEDADRDGIRDASEPTLDNITIELFEDVDGDGVFEPGGDDGIAIQTTITANGGYYIFDNLEPGSYFTRIAPDEFASGDLVNYVATIKDVGNAADDENSNGNNPTNITDITTIGLVSDVIVLEQNAEPTTDADKGPEGNGRNGEEDDDSDLTIDFGVFRPLAIGNRVWSDNGNGDLAFRDDGIQNNGESGIPNVVVNLYADTDGDGNIDYGTPYATTRTDANGYYLFDYLPEGQYVVEVSSTNFDSPGDPLYQVFSSNTGNTEADSTPEQHDSGIDDPNPQVNGIRSAEITLAIGTEATTEDSDLGPGGDGTNGEVDANSDLTVDFGFVTPPMSIGNRLWFDFNNNGVIDSGENFVNGARIDIYNDANNDGIPDVSEFIEFVTTDADGYYLFDNLTPGNYIVVVNERNFRTGGVLQDFVSTQNTPTPTDDDRDTLDPAITGNTDDGIDNLTPDVTGIRSSVITLVPGGEYQDETDKSPDGDGTNGEETSNSNLTVDFGFYKPMSIGNRVWFDENTDGLISTGENGAANVRVSLLSDTTGNGIPDTVIASDTTDANGYYLFDNLTPGAYQVVIDGSNFSGTGALAGTTSTQTDVSNPPVDDNNDNGIDPVDYTNGVLSAIITLSLDGQPIGESDFSNDQINDGPDYIGRNGEQNNNSDISIDFGFTSPTMSVGNRVWFDLDNNGLIDASEDGVANVNLSLYPDNNGDGMPDGGAIATVTTDADGYYLFENISPGNYVIGLDAVNFESGNLLEGYGSTITNVNNLNGNEATYPPDQDDSNDNGLDTFDPTYGILSDSFSLEFNQERTDEADLGILGNGTGITPENSDLTIDFGVNKPMALGNRVWFDTDDSSTINSTETGAANVVVNLYRDSNDDGIPDDLDNNGIFGDAGDILATETTDTNGYYLFDDLTAGNYIVGVDGSNFTGSNPLAGTVSSTLEANDDTTDRDDNGRNTPDSNGTILSNTITLEYDTEPTDDADKGPDGDGANGEEDDNSNLTVDFGFVPTDVYSIGNRVWLDDDANGLRDGTNIGIANIQMVLYRDANSDGIPDDIDGNGIAGDVGDILTTDTTDTNGYYLFDNLTPGNYLVGVAPTNFTGNNPLRGYASTIATTNAPIEDDNDNRNTPVRTDSYNTTYGILSDTVVLGSGTPPIGESDLGPDGVGAHGETDATSDLTIDFGFYPSLPLGNRVWFDTDDDGTINNGESGIANVTVNLYRDSNDDGIPDDLDNNGIFGDAGDIVQTDVTDGGGYYLFNNLPPGSYVVSVAGSNFNAGNALENLSSSTGVATEPDSTDSNDNGIDIPFTNGDILSETVTLSANNAPVGESDTSGNTEDGPNFIGINNERDNNSNITVDFGFNGSPMSIGNRVWLDDGNGGGINNDGIINGAEIGIPNVVVELFADADGNGAIDSNTPLATTTTDSNGHYLFDNLSPGNYLVRIAPSNFQSSAPLAGLFSSEGVQAIDTSSQDQGLDDTDPATNGIISRTIILEQNQEPTTDEDDLSGDTTTYGPDSRGNNGETNENSNLTLDFGFATVYDWGDAPDSYGTTNGPNHVITPNLYLGFIVDDEMQGQPNANADGDDANNSDDEDGVAIPSSFVAGTTVNIDVTVVNNTGNDATLVAWFDWNGNGTFDSNEAITDTIPSRPDEQVISLPVTVPQDADITTRGSSFARIRISTSEINTPTGSAPDGEVEDYPIALSPPGLVISKTDGLNAIVVGQSTTYTITIGNSGEPVQNRNVVDNLPVSNPNGFDPATVTWSCTAINGASCIAGQAGGTGDSGTGSINSFIDIPRGGQIVFELTGTLRGSATDATITNVASIDLGDGTTAEDDDVNGIIYDPPRGTKVGTVINGNLIRWTNTWYNTGSAQSATISDTLPSDQTFAGNLSCVAYGLSTTSSCTYNNGRVVWSGVIDNGVPNRVEIAFDVTVQGEGSYTNTATLESNNSTASTSGTVVIGEGDSSNNLSNIGIDLRDPTIVKFADPILALPGEPVTWIIQISNPNNIALTNITVVDDVPADFEILSVSTTNGTVTVNGQQVSLIIEAFNANETVQLIIETRILESVTSDILVNVAWLDICECEATSQVLLVGELPSTGEISWRIGMLRSIAGFAIVITVISLSLFLWRHFSNVINRN